MKNNNITFNTTYEVYYYKVEDIRHNNIIRFVCPELFSKEQFRNLKDYILGVEFGKNFSEKPLVRNTKGECYEVMIGNDFKFEVRKVIADPNTLKGAVLKDRFPEQILKKILTELLIPKDDITISSWTEFVKGCNLLDELEDEKIIY